MTVSPEQHNEELRLKVDTDEFCAGYMLDQLTSYNMIGDLMQQMQITGVPKRFKGASLADFSDKVQGQVNTALNAGRSLFLYGKVGRGKTSLAAAVLRELKRRIAVEELVDCWENSITLGWERGKNIRQQIQRFIGTAFSKALREPQVLFNNAPELMDNIKRCFDAKDDPHTESKQELVARYGSVPVLILDDIGMEKPTDFVRETFDTIVNQRWADEMFTIFTSNLTFDEIEEHYADRRRISSRIAGMCDVIELVGEDRRLR